MNPHTVTSKQDLFFQNLLELGFDVQSMSKEHRISFDKKMFCVPNQKAFEVVSYFLFIKLNEVSTEKYKIQWPLLEVKDHRQFQKTCFSHLASIAQGSNIRFPIVSQFVLSSFGDAFYELYFAFSTHVVLKTNENYGTSLLKRAQADHRFHKQYTRVLQVSTIAAVKRFTEVVEVSKHHLETYFKCARNLMTFVNKLKITNASTDAQLEEEEKHLVCVYGETSLDDIILKKEEYQRKIEKDWTQLESFLSKEEKLWNYLCTELEDENEKPILEGSQYNSSILQDNLNKSHCSQHKHNLWTEEKGLNIYELIKMSTCILELYRSSILKGNFSQTSSFGLLKDTTEYEATFEKLKHLSDQLQKDNVLMEDGIKQLIDKFQFPDDCKNTIYEELPPSSNAFINSKCINILELEKFTNISIVEDELAMSNNASNLSDECKSRVSLPHNQIRTNIESDLNLCPQSSSFPLSFQEIVKESSMSSSSKKLTDDLCNTLKETSINSPKGNTPEFNIPSSWYLEESLNSQSLVDQLSFLD